MTAVRPTGIVTFLFTDIDGSTGRWEAQSAEMGAALARHDDALRTAIEAHGGWLFKHHPRRVLLAERGRAGGNRSPAHARIAGADGHSDG